MLLFLADTIFFGAIVAFAILINFLFVPLGFTNVFSMSFLVINQLIYCYANNFWYYWCFVDWISGFKKSKIYHNM